MFTKRTQLAGAIALLCAGAAHAGDVNFSGFLTAAGGKASDDSLLAYAGYSEEDMIFDTDTLVGLQVSGIISDKVTATAQLVARGSEDYSVESEWAYISYQVNDNFKWRMGRLRTPLYMLSDYVDVGYAYNWITAPSEVYYLPFNNVQGIDILYNFTAGPFDGLLQAYTGAFSDSFVLTGVEVNTRSRGQSGVALQLNYDWLTFRTAYHQAELSLDLNLFSQLAAGAESICDGFAAANQAFAGFSDCGNIDYTRYEAQEDDATFLDVALSIDTGRFLAVAETSSFEIEDSPFSDDKRSYVMLGVRFGDFVVHYTHARAKDEGKSDELLAGLPEDVGTNFAQGHPLYVTQETLRVGLAQIRDGSAAAAQSQVDEHTTNTIGVRWDFASAAAFKFQVDSVERESDDPEQDGEKQTVIRFAIQSVF